MSEQAIERKHTDARGCLTDAGLVVLREALPGAVPEDLASHLASCVSCQQRALATEAGPRRRGGKAPREVLPSLGRTALLGFLLLGAVALLLWSLRLMAGS